MLNAATRPVDTETDRPPLPRTVLLMEFLIKRLQLRAVPPFSFNAGAALIAVGGGLLVPRWFGRLAGGLLQMQALALVTLVWLLVMLVANNANIAEGRRRNRDPKVVRGELRGMTWMFDFVFVIALGLSIKFAGPLGPLGFTFLAGTAVIGGAGGSHDWRDIAELGGRLAVALIALIVVAGLFGLPIGDSDRLPGAAGSIPAAGIYFGALALAEATGIYPWLARALIKATQSIASFLGMRAR